MLELSNKYFKAAMIKMLSKPTVYIFETNEKTESLSMKNCLQEELEDNEEKNKWKF